MLYTSTSTFWDVHPKGYVLVVCYTVAVLCANLGLVLLHAVAHQYTRSLYGLGHVYIGQGQHAGLRISLGGIETLSGLFRAVSLSLRVVCNATAGHVLLAVLVEMTLATLVESGRYHAWYLLSTRSPIGCIASQGLHMSIPGI